MRLQLRVENKGKKKSIISIFIILCKGCRLSPPNWEITPFEFDISKCVLTLPSIHRLPRNSRVSQLPSQVYYTAFFVHNNIYPFPKEQFFPMMETFSNTMDSQQNKIEKRNKILYFII